MIHLPVPSDSLSKFSGNITPNFCKIFGHKSIQCDKNLVYSAFSSASWRSMEAAWNSFISFCKCSNYHSENLISQKFLSDYISFLFLTKKLKHSTVESYLSSLSTIFRIKGVDAKLFYSFQTKLQVRGGKNMEYLSSPPSPTRKVMTLEILRIIGHEIAISDWSSDSKRVFWAACCTLFFGSFRVGEILSNSGKNFSPKTCLLWGDIQFKEGRILIHVKSPKHMSKEGDFVDIFPFEEKSCCPFRVLSCLKSKSKFSLNAKLPVFTFKSGLNLTPTVFNKTLRLLLSSHLGSLSAEYSSHSFRAAISSALAKFPDLALFCTIQCYSILCSNVLVNM